MKRTRIGLLLHEYDLSFSRDFMDGADSWCREHDLDLVVFSARSPNWPFGFEYQHLSVYSMIRRHSVDALIVLTGIQCNYIKLDEYVRWLEPLRDIPLVSISIPLPGIPSVVADIVPGLTAVVDHVLHVHGRLAPLVITGPVDNPESVQRLDLVKKRLSINGIELDSSRILVGGFNTSASYNAMEQFLKGPHPEFSCVIALSDMMAMGALRALQEKGYRVPEDVIVTGFDDIKHASYHSPTISTVSQDMYGQSRFAASIAERLTRGESVPLVHEVPCRALFRQSCGCVAKLEPKINAVDESGNNVLWHVAFSGSPGYERFLIEDDVYRMRNYIARLNTVFTLSELLETLQHDLESFRIQSAALVLYDERITCKKEDEFMLPDHARLILSYDLDWPEMRDSEGVSFNPRQMLLPDGTFSDRRRKLVVTSMHQQEDLLGYLVFEPGKMSSGIYEILCVQLSHIISFDLVYMENLLIEENLGALREHLEKTNRELDSMSRVDELTGLYNRRGFLALGQQAIRMYQRMNKGGLVIFGDLDGLKYINDTWGHDAGDRALIAMSVLLRKAFRAVDIIARLSGDEFAVVAVESNRESYRNIRMRLDALLAEWNRSSGEPFCLSISLGSVSFGKGQYNLEKLLSGADRLLYDEKRKKRQARP